MNEWEILGWFERFNEGVVFSVPFVRSHFYRCYYLFFSRCFGRIFFLFAPFKRQISVYYLKDDVNTHSFILSFFSVVVVGGAFEKRLIVRELDGDRRCHCCWVAVVSFIVRWSSLRALRGHIYRQTYLHCQNTRRKKKPINVLSLNNPKRGGEKSDPLKKKKTSKATPNNKREKREETKKTEKIKRDDRSLKIYIATIVCPPKNTLIPNKTPSKRLYRHNSGTIKINAEPKNIKQRPEWNWRVIPICTHTHTHILMLLWWIIWMAETEHTPQQQ